MITDEGQNAAVGETIRHHHARMVEALEAQVSRLAQASLEDDWQAARAALVDHVRREIIPHAKAEEATIYHAARQEPQLTPLITAMVLEHGHILKLTDDLASASNALAALRIGAGLEALFAAHADNENSVIVPALEGDRNVSLRDILREMQLKLAAASETADPNAPPADDDPILLDVRQVPHAQRHALIVGLLSHLGEHQRLILTVDHDPLPLRYQLAARYGDRLGWAYEDNGPKVWRIVVTLGA